MINESEKQLIAKIGVQVIALDQRIQEKDELIANLVKQNMELAAKVSSQESHIPTKVRYFGKTTIAYFKDGPKFARPNKDEKFDPETGLAMCIAKHVYGGRSAFLRAVEKAKTECAATIYKDVKDLTPNRTQPDYAKLYHLAISRQIDLNFKLITAEAKLAARGALIKRMVETLESGTGIQIYPSIELARFRDWWKKVQAIVKEARETK